MVEKAKELARSQFAVIQNLTKKLLEIDSETRNQGGTIVDVAQRQENFIRYYPIPDSKSDLIALMWHRG